MMFYHKKKISHKELEELLHWKNFWQSLGFEDGNWIFQTFNKSEENEMNMKIIDSTAEFEKFIVELPVGKKMHFYIADKNLLKGKTLPFMTIEKIKWADVFLVLMGGNGLEVTTITFKNTDEFILEDGIRLPKNHRYAKENYQLSDLGIGDGKIKIFVGEEYMDVDAIEEIMLESMKEKALA